MGEPFSLKKFSIYVLREVYLFSDNTLEFNFPLGSNVPGGPAQLGLGVTPSSKNSSLS